MDPLTHLWNRRGASVLLKGAFAGADQRGTPLALALLDLDNFKRINDTRGHQAGDEVLRAVAAALATELRGAMSAGRLGGEEFLLLLPGAELESARQVAERVRSSIARVDVSRWFSGRPLSVSIGVSLAHPGPAGVTEGLRRADDALYAAKEAGRDRVHVDRPVRVA